MESNTKMATLKSVISTIGSVAAGAMVARTIINDFLPHDIHDYLFSSVRSFFSRRFSNQLTLIINEYDGLETNQIFEAAELYLGTLTKSSLSSTASSAHRLRVTKPESEKSIQVAVDQNEEVVDEFQGVKFTWVLQCHRVEGENGRNFMRHEVRAFYLTFHKKDNNKGLALDKYLPYVLDRAALLKQENKTIKLFTVEFNCLYGAPADAWSSVKLNHPATFDTLALDPELKNMIIDDLDRFVKRKEYYRRVGKAWKRGYLLYGPPGTGKSSLIAAMANYLNFDIYDLEMSAVTSDSDLRKILVGTGNRSIVVVEDIDCSVNFKDRELPKDTEEGNNNDAHYNEIRHVTLSGLLNFIDGLWSSCGDERIIIFTTNHKEKLDPALLRPGRMDMHIHMSYCTASGFNVLARNYLGVKSDNNNHEAFREIERLIEEAQVTPAEVAEQLIKHDEPNAALGGLVDFFKFKISENALVVKDVRPNDGLRIVKESNESKLEGESIRQSVKNL